MSQKLKHNDKLIQINRLGRFGEGIGKFNDKTCFVPGALPGEEVTLKEIQSRKTHYVAKINEIVKPSPDRIVAKCPYYEQCGGCQIMHFSYSGQLEYKRGIVVGAMEKIGRLTDTSIVEECLPSPYEFFYRNKMQVVARSFSKKNSSLQKELGFFAFNSHKIVPIDACMIQNKLLNKTFLLIKNILKDSSVPFYVENKHKGVLRNILLRTNLQETEIGIIFVINADESKELKKIAEILIRETFIKSIYQNTNTSRSNTILGQKFKRLAGIPILSSKLMKSPFIHTANTFLQVNSKQMLPLYQLAIQAADLKPSDLVVDAYCGIGTLTSLIAAKVQNVTGIEINQESIDLALENAETNKIPNMQFIVGKVEEKAKILKNCTKIFLDPPRKGCAKKVIEQIIHNKIAKIVYISCDPFTLGRDIQLLRQGGYEIKSITPIDMFPQTTHVETLAILERPSLQ